MADDHHDPALHTSMATLGEARTIIENEENTLRFEEFCNRIVSRMIGRPVLGTAPARDLGVDGRAVQLDALSGELLVAASTRKDALAKMAEDAARLRETHPQGATFFCTSMRLTETQKSAARKKLAGILGRTSGVNVLSQDELADLAIRYAGPLDELYVADLQELRIRLAEVLSESGGTAQLQIAHILTSSEGFSNRDLIAELLVTEIVARRASTVNEVCAGLQVLLRMPGAFQRYVVEAALGRLDQRGSMNLRHDRRYELTQVGRNDRLARLDRTEAEEKARKERFAAEVVSHLGYAVAPDQQDRLWHHLMQEMSVLLAQVGARFVAVIEAARESSDLNEVRALASDSVRTACRAAVAGIKDPRVRSETEEALYQSLLESPSIAQEWLEDTIAAWLAACQLGLVPEISQELRPAIQKMVLALDTDVVLSLLCEAEPDNGALSQLLTQWASIGGRTLIAREVLGEVAHHAWIARAEFHEIASILKTLRYNPGLARQIARNAFVRSFWASGRSVSTPEFDRYIRSYAGSSGGDTGSVQATLDRLTVGQRLPVPTVPAMSPFLFLEPKIKRVLARAARFAPHDQSGGAIAQDKMDRDAAAIVKYAAVAHSSDSSITSLLLLSSSKRLRLAVRRGAANTRIVVAPTSTLGLLLAAVFAQQINPRSIAQLLIAEGAREQVGYVRNELTRMLARANLLAMLPRARIVSLEREVEMGVLDYAKRSSRSPQLVRKEVLTASNKDVALQVLSGALRKTALGAETDRLIRAQADEIERLRGGGSD